MSKPSQLAMEKYFWKPSAWPLAFFLGGLALSGWGTYFFLCSQPVKGAIYAMFAIFLFWVAFYKIRHACGAPSTYDVDRYIEHLLDQAKIRALQKVGLSEADLIEKPLVFTAPQFWDTGGASIHYRVAADGVIRFTPLHVTVLYLTEDRLAVWEACLDLMTGNFLNESTDEYFYQDIVSVGTRKISKTCYSEEFGKLHLAEAEAFVITTTWGTSTEVVLTDPLLVRTVGNGKFSTSEAENAVQIIRSVLRRKKAKC